jgi:hypothetical protein
VKKQIKEKEGQESDGLTCAAAAHLMNGGCHPEKRTGGKGKGAPALGFWPRHQSLLGWI